MTSLLKKIILATSCVVTLCLGAMPAQAAVIVGQFDPVYGGGFTNMGWRGSITLTVDNSCLAADGVFNTVQCPGMQTDSAQVQLYQLNDNSIFGSINFLNGPQLTAIQVAGGQVTGFSTFGCFECGSYSAAPLGLGFATGYEDFSYGLGFSLTAPVAQLYAAIYQDDVTADSAAILFTGGYNPFDDGFASAASHLASNCQRVFGDGGTYYECTSDGVAKLTITTEVPEPGSLALMFGALGALGWARQRRLPQR